MEFDPNVISLERLLSKILVDVNLFHRTYGTQYQSGIWYTSEAQGEVVQKEAERKANGREIKMVIAPLDKFYRAEEYHQQYYQKLRHQS